MIDPIKIVIHDFPKVFSVVVNSFIVTYHNLKTKCSLSLKENIFIKTFVFEKSFASLKIKDKSIVNPKLYLKSNVSMGIKEKSCHTNISNVAVRSLFKVAQKTEIKSFLKLNSIVAIFLKWTDRKSETWNNVNSLTNKQFILREIK